MDWHESILDGMESKARDASFRTEEIAIAFYFNRLENSSVDATLDIIHKSWEMVQTSRPVSVLELAPSIQRFCLASEMS